MDVPNKVYFIPFLNFTPNETLILTPSLNHEAALGLFVSHGGTGQNSPHNLQCSAIVLIKTYK